MQGHYSNGTCLLHTLYIANKLITVYFTQGYILN